MMLAGLALMLGMGVVRADYTFTVNGGSIQTISGAGNGFIPDGNMSGMAALGNVGGLAGNVSSVSVTLNVNGGFNGDLDAYLVAPLVAGHTPITATLLGTPGGNFDQTGSGLNITIADGGASYSGTAQADGTKFTGGPFSPVVALNTTFGGLAANGTWRLFLVDQSPGGGQAVLNGWSLTITTASVPEPNQVAAIIMIGLVGLMAGNYRSWARALGFRPPPSGLSDRLSSDI